MSTPPQSQIDRIGQYIGNVRVYKGLPLESLARGLCTTAYLCRVERGERETDKLLTDALLQRLGSPTELFWRLLDQDEFLRWQQRQNILAYLRQGDIVSAQAGVDVYRVRTPLDRQFIQTVEINLRALQGAPAAELSGRALSALQLTQPDFEKQNFENLLLSQTEGYLLLAYLEQKERLNGPAAVETAYHALLRLLRCDHYDARERIYLLPYAACHVIEAEYRNGRLHSALALCEEALSELSNEERLYACESLLKWKLHLLDAAGMDIQPTQKLLEWLQILQPSCPKHLRLLIPLIERGCVCCLNQVIQDRRKLLGLSQEELADGICGTTTLSRIETWKSSPQKRVRRLLLQKLHMSGERYDYDIIPERHNDYILRSEIDRAHSSREYRREARLLAELRGHISPTQTNLQFLEWHENELRALGPGEFGPQITPQEELAALKANLRRTLPLNIDEIGAWPVTSLSNNEVLLLLNIARRYKTSGQPQIGLAVSQYVLSCLKHMDLGGARCNEELDTLAYLQTLSCLGDCGRYKESTRLAWECVWNNLAVGRTVHIAGILYNIAWNLEHQQNANYQHMLYLFKLAYAAALLQGDRIERQHIQKHCLNFLGVELTL